LQPALQVGRQAAGLRLDTLDLARIHEQALARLDISNRNKALLKLAKKFFTEALSATAEAPQGARQSNIDLVRLNETLGRRTVELAASNRDLRRGILRRKGVEAALRKRGKHSVMLLKDSLQVQEDMRHRTHRILVAQEKERKAISHQLQDEIVQTLLSILVRLLSLKKAANGNTAKLASRIASTQRLVEASVQLIDRFARELYLPQHA